MVARNKSAIDGLRRANKATAQLLQELAQIAKPGVTTRDLDDYALRYMRGLGADPVFATEKGFPGCINTSVNNAAVHGVPGAYALQEGDVLKIDAGMLLDGYCGDSTITIAIGEVGPERRRLISTTYAAMMAGIRVAKAGNRVGDIGHAMQRYAETRGYGVLREYTGHGLGHQMHEEPLVPSVGRPHTGPLLQEGLVITIEPILVEQSPRVVVDPDGWTVRTADGGWAAQFEHTVVVGKRGATILSVA